MDCECAMTETKKHRLANVAVGGAMTETKKRGLAYWTPRTYSKPSTYMMPRM